MNLPRFLPRVLLALACIALWPSCASTTFRTYEGPSLSKGLGGTRDSVDGVDFWRDGTPPRNFRVVGIIDDSRPGGIIPMARLERDVARKAKEQGGDAVISLGSVSDVTGYLNTMNATTTVSPFNPYVANTSATGSTIPVRRNHAKFAVIKYL